MPATSAYPVHTLREHATALEAAIATCLAEPDERAVHKVRTETRRVEAQLELLRLLKGLPSYKAEARKVRRQLKKLRRAAARVRDLDVRHELIEASAEETASRPKDGKHKDEASALHTLSKGCRKERKRAARKLQKIVETRQAKISRALHSLLNALEPAVDLRVSVENLVALLEGQFASTHALMIRNPSNQHLHSIRKAAKLARYMAENAPKGSPAARTAKRYETVQEAGGHWHDWLDLSEAAADQFGEQHPLTTSLLKKRDRRLAAYESLLSRLRER